MTMNPNEFAEYVGRAIWESQRARIGSNTKLTWRDKQVPDKFWDSYVDDANAAIEAIILAGNK